MLPPLFLLPAHSLGQKKPEVPCTVDRWNARSAGPAVLCCQLAKTEMQTHVGHGSTT